MSPLPAVMKGLQSKVTHANTDTSEAENQDTESLGFNTLYDPEPNSAVADLIFIHGLGGHSRKTWSSSSTLKPFWPRDWLPNETGFENVRIHSFGYKADWGGKWQQQSILNIHDFAESLIGGLKNHPGIRQDSTYIILVGHSMGGCIAKEAYIIARQHPSYKDLAGRIYGIFFLGTPHHGSDLAGVLENMSIAIWGKKPFVTDLKSGSSALAMIRDRFRHVAMDLALWTFYETQPTALGPISRIVVEKYSAILGFDNERIEAMNADHRHVCKFTSRKDSNYKMLQNALHTAIDEIKEKSLDRAFLQLGTTDDRNIETDSRLKYFLKIPDMLEEDLMIQSELKMPESCEWFTNKPQFISWKAGDAPTILWLTGRPATGKSILASHVIDHLNHLPVCCSYFFFKHSISDKSTLRDCFRSLAFQMATQDNLVKEKLIQFEHEGIVWDKASDALIWTKLFVDRIFKLPFARQHFWVIDALDECDNFNALFTKKLLTKLPLEGKLQVFITSRNLEAIERGRASLGPQVSTYFMSDSDTIDDIRLFLTTKLEELDRFETKDDLEAMCNRMLEKSSGSFLWARLVSQEFENVWTEEAMEAILKEIPGELYDLYGKMIRSIQMDKSKAILAKTILTWVVLARRPLSLEELRCVVKLDLNQTLQSVKRAIPEVCGQLVYIDAAEKAHVIHETAREFLLDQNICRELAIYKDLGHTSIASTLLKFLSGGCLKTQPMRFQRPSKQKQKNSVRTRTLSSLDTSLLDYAAMFFSEHVYRCTSKEDGVMDILCTFLDNSILSWIEYLAKGCNLSPINRVAMNLRDYLARRAKYVPHTDLSISIVAGWVTDLIRVASKTWDDCLSRIDFPKGHTTAVSHGNSIFAVGLSTGKIFLYNAEPIQPQLTMTHPERVKALQFSEHDDYLASCGVKYMIIWKPKAGTQLYQFSLPSSPLGITFLGLEEIICAFQSGICVAFLVTTEVTLLAVGFRMYPVLIWGIDEQQILGQCVIDANNGIDCMVFNPNPDIIALVVSCNDGRLCIFDYFTMNSMFVMHNVYAHSIACSPDGYSLVTGSSQGMIEIFGFDQDNDGNIILVPIYRIDGLYDPIKSLVFSFNGQRFLDIHGQQCRAWEPAALVRRNDELESTSDAANLPIPVARTMDSSEEPEITSLLEISANGWYAIAGNQHGEVHLFSVADGRKVGTLYRHAKGVSVTKVTLGERKNLIVSADESGRVLISEPPISLREAATVVPGQKMAPARTILDRRFGGAVMRLLLNSAADRLLVTGHNVSELWALPSGEVLAVKQESRMDGSTKDSRFSDGGGLATTSACAVFQHPTNEAWFVTVSGDIARVFGWANYEELTSPDGILLQRPISSEKPASPRELKVSPKSERFPLQPLKADYSFAAASYHVGCGVVIESLRKIGTVPQQFYMWPAAVFDPSSPRMSDYPVIEPSFSAISSHIRSVIGFIGPSTLVFLDTSLWICSIEIQSTLGKGDGNVGSSGSSLPVINARRHFFALSEWCDAEGEMKCSLVVVPGMTLQSNGHGVVFVNGHRLVTVKGGFQFSEEMLA
ncbi:hypothetical protein M441DRAFT_191126 [Trichoderma asperellum CBS 433.97]|uniref:GPI inositol-deacylase n=1 Tax=Trichoderma asperellum (strain ATCC 204424 / CBS 433.97 / NBRC 101777) TaxID=1042311 RepID=A0A2T3ZC94_TRIA4|nr:hypothetical protein M441DRAFT_191126 [Trichoderma asperellum CBS 433.97]PTB42433.1 hypothetical protein M441DRAFT_191126 [Trichoderma asperellum CBS 433.97]